jgi:hypothetical protein
LRPHWHALFAPLPADAAVQRARLLVPGWEQITVELSAGEAGLRHVMLVLDETGTPVSAGDWVMYCTQSEGETTYVHENVGGRLEADGTFSGTRWRSVAVEREGSEEAKTQEMTSSKPSGEDVAGIRALVKELLSRSA